MTATRFFCHSWANQNTVFLPYKSLSIRCIRQLDVAGSFECFPFAFRSHLPGIFPDTVIPLCVADNVEVPANDMEVNDEPATADAGATAVIANGGSAREETDPSQRWKSLETLLCRESPFGAETGQLAVGMYEPFEDVSGKMFPRPKACIYWNFLGNYSEMMNPSRG